ncbi:MAG: CBS domain-containing protein [Halioglobus sp.]|nr:CBS domain-containing protein [Halioglobus sp.]
MRSHPLTIHPGASLVQAVEIILENRLTGLTVTDDQGGVVGILSELDCLKATLTAIYNEGDPAYTTVGDAMSRVVRTCTSGDSIVEVAQDMLDSSQRRRPVIEDDKLVGQVSSSNILWALIEHSRRKMREQGS